jgi:hypothetical protein
MVYVYCSYGDHLVSPKKEPVDSPAAVEAMIEWMARSYGMRRMYWRGGGEELWDHSMQFGKETPFVYDLEARWRRDTFRKGTTRAVVSAAKKFGMDIYMYASLFDYGVQPDIGIIGPYLFEDRARIEHPDWCMADRWGERRCPGPIEFGFPEARQFVIRRYVEYVTEHGYDGINFYTYVENCGIRYMEEFGFSEPIVQAFRERYPDTDLRKDRLTEEQKRHWYACRGRFVTDFIRELHAELTARGKKLSVILDSGDPDYVQPWWAWTVPGTGYIRIDWQQWVKEGIVDELWVQLGETGKQTATLDHLLRMCAGTPIKLTVRTPKPFDPVWEPYIAAGVTPVAVVTSPVNGIERLVPEPSTSADLFGNDWIKRAQALADMAAGRIGADAEAAAALASDRHLLVRQRAMRALKAVGASAQLPSVYAGLTDKENCVRVAAAEAAGYLNDGDTPRMLFAAIDRDDSFLMKLACVGSLVAMGETCIDEVIAGLKYKCQGVREVCARALKGLGEMAGFEVYPHLACMLRDEGEDENVRYWAIDSLFELSLKGRLTARSAEDFITELAALVCKESSTVVQLHAARELGKMAEEGLLDGKFPDAILQVECLFRKYGDGCMRTDAAFGWRLAGNALLSFGEPGRELLRNMREQKQDKWLSWLAYEVEYLPHRKPAIELCEEQQAIVDHDRYAPAFPGYRPW